LISTDVQLTACIYLHSHLNSERKVVHQGRSRSFKNNNHLTARYVGQAGRARTRNLWNSTQYTIYDMIVCI